MKQSKVHITPNPLSYGIGKIVSAYYNLVLNNHIEYKNGNCLSGPAVILSNHPSSYDQFVSCHAISNRMVYLVGDAILYTLPFPSFFDSFHLLHKQQNFTSVTDIKEMKAVIAHKGILMLYPTGNCSLCGENTGLPLSTGKLLKLLGADVYIIKEHGMYLSNPKWQKGIRRGRAETEVYRLFHSDELKNLSPDRIYEMTETALRFNDYEWQESHHIIYKNGSQIGGLENVLYDCPKCNAHFSIINTANHLTCSKCGFEEYADEYGFLHSSREDYELRYPMQWHRVQIDILKKKTEQDTSFRLEVKADIMKLDKEKRKFVPAGQGSVQVDKTLVKILLDDGRVIYTEDTSALKIMPMIPGAYFDLQNGTDIFRCFPEEKKNAAYVADFINVLNKDCL